MGSRCCGGAAGSPPPSPALEAGLHPAPSGSLEEQLSENGWSLLRQGEPSWPALC